MPLAFELLNVLDATFSALPDENSAAFSGFLNQECSSATVKQVGTGSVVSHLVTSNYRVADLGPFYSRHWTIPEVSVDLL